MLQLQFLSIASPFTRNGAAFVRVNNRPRIVIQDEKIFGLPIDSEDGRDRLVLEARQTWRMELVGSVKYLNKFVEVIGDYVAMVLDVNEELMISIYSTSPENEYMTIYKSTAGRTMLKIDDVREIEWGTNMAYEMVETYQMSRVEVWFPITG